MNKLVDAYMDTFRDTCGVYGDEPAPIIDEPGNAILDLDARLTMLEQQVQTIALNTLKMAEHIRDLRRQSTAAPKSAIVLPHGFDPRGH